MDVHVVLLFAIIFVQLYSIIDEIRSLLINQNVTNHLLALSTNLISLISTILTAVCSYRLRRIRKSLWRVEQSLQIAINKHKVNGCWSFEYRARAWLTVAVLVFGYLKYGQLLEFNGEDQRYATIAVTLLRTISMAGNYYVTLMFVDHVFLAKRSVQTVIIWYLINITF